MLSPKVAEWLNLALRWTHVVAAIFWVGTTAYFSWLDRAVKRGGAVWMVHSGGFYVVEKRADPGGMPPVLHWFKWEAATTWLSGVLLLVLVFHLDGMVCPEETMRPPIASAAALALLPVAWLVYDLLWLSPLRRVEPLAALVGLGLLVGAAYGLGRWMLPRAAWFHLGAVIGTIMAANVWVRILPAQRRMVRALQEGRTPDPALGERAKSRSKHNTFLAIPLVMMMLSNHFPTITYGNGRPWLMVGAFFVCGWIVRRVLNHAG